ncbi:unnamed protein product [Rhodiola kirilowii]
MKLGMKKNGWKSIVPLNSGDESATQFCLFQKVKPSAYEDEGHTPVYLNVYDLTDTNSYVYWADLGIFHSGFEVHGVEYTFGAHDYPTSGVFGVEPRKCPGFKFRKSIFIGTTYLSENQVRDFMERYSAYYNGDSYHLITKNCNHFCKDICHKLTGKPIPKWVNRLAKIGSTCNRILPKSLKVTAVIPESDYQTGEGEKRRLQNAFSCLSSISLRQKQLQTSSLLLHSPLRSFLPQMELKRHWNSLLRKT